MKRFHILSAALLAAGAILPASGAVHAQRAADAYARTTIFAGLQSGGVYSSAGGGDTWQESDNGLPLDANVLALQAGSPNTIYAGTSGQGVFVSDDGGQSWQDDNGGNSDLAGETVVGLAVDPRFGETVFAAAQGGTVYISYHGVRTWLESTVGTASNLTAIADSLGISNTVLVGTQDDGVYLSPRGGDHWQATSGIPSGIAVNALAFDPRNSQVAYAATDDGMYQSVDGGYTWLPEGRGLPAGVTLSAVAVDPHRGATVLAGASDGTFYRSTDGGTSWRYVDTTLTVGAINALVFDPAGGVAYAGTSGPINFSSSNDGGNSWHWDYYFPSSSAVQCLAVLNGSPLPTAAEPPIPNSPVAQYFPQSHHIVSGPFLSFFKKYGGVKIFGLPLTSVFAEDGHLVQYFERARLALAGRGVQVSPLGEQVTAGRYFPPVAPFRSTATRLYFASTHHSLSGWFLAFWRTHHGALLFGAPISQPLYEQNGDGTGRAYLVQYFQNARMEYHPELAGTSYNISLGLLGQQVLKQRGWL